MDSSWNAALKERSQERRGPDRRAANVVVQMATPQGLFFGYARNVSLGGICVESDVRLSVGTRARLAFRLCPDLEEPLRLEARLAWSEPSNTPALQRLGFTFEGLSEEEARQIESYA
jgi:Tfp pilus assembly protein PilZ